MMPGAHILLTTHAALQNCSNVYGKDDMFFHCLLFRDITVQKLRYTSIFHAVILSIFGNMPILYSGVEI